jgi:hypothetical protein
MSTTETVTAMAYWDEQEANAAGGGVILPPLLPPLLPLRILPKIGGIFLEIGLGLESFLGFLQSS